MKQKAMGTAHSVPTPRPTWAMDPVDVGCELETERLGFRLVYDDQGRADHGSSWNYAAEYARTGERNWLFPINHGSILGFRLVWERS